MAEWAKFFLKRRPTEVQLGDRKLQVTQGNASVLFSFEWFDNCIYHTQGPFGQANETHIYRNGESLAVGSATHLKWDFDLGITIVYQWVMSECEVMQNYNIYGSRLNRFWRPSTGIRICKPREPAKLASYHIPKCWYRQGVMRMDHPIVTPPLLLSMILTSLESLSD
jgi:hypothetical protein